MPRYNSMWESLKLVFFFFLAFPAFFFYKPAPFKKKVQEMKCK